MDVENLETAMGIQKNLKSIENKLDRLDRELTIKNSYNWYNGDSDKVGYISKKTENTIKILIRADLEEQKQELLNTLKTL